MARRQHADPQVPNLMSLTYQAPIPEATAVPRCWKVVMRRDPSKKPQKTEKTTKPQKPQNREKVHCCFRTSPVPVGTCVHRRVAIADLLPRAQSPQISPELAARGGSRPLGIRELAQ